jgi:hypothetical protein
LTLNFDTWFDTYYFVPDAFSLSPNEFAGRITLEIVNPLDDINKYYKNGVIYQVKGILNQSVLWILNVTFNNKKIILIPMYSL